MQDNKGGRARAIKLAQIYKGVEKRNKDNSAPKLTKV